MPFPIGVLPYCGLAATPDALWHRWNLDPILMGALVALYAGYLFWRAASTGQLISTMPLDRDLAYFTIGWVVLSAALISPLCALSVALFSARVGQHMIITMVAAPLIVLGRPFSTFATLAHTPLGKPFTGRLPKGSLGVIGVISFAVLVWLWHTPVFYTATFRSDLIYWAMHLSLFGSSFLLWDALLICGADRPLAAFGLGFATVSQMSLLGAIITFAARPLFPEHLLTTAVWGLSPLQDQQFGGLIMWIPGCAILTVAAIGLAAKALCETESPTKAASAVRR